MAAFLHECLSIVEDGRSIAGNGYSLDGLLAKSAGPPRLETNRALTAHL